MKSVNSYIELLEMKNLTPEIKISPDGLSRILDFMEGNIGV